VRAKGQIASSAANEAATIQSRFDVSPRCVRPVFKFFGLAITFRIAFLRLSRIPATVNEPEAI
jgi:hypothetical protein